MPRKSGDKKSVKEAAPRSRPKQDKELVLIEGDNTLSFFANHVECRVSNEDAAITFALRKYSSPENEANVLCRSYLALPHFVRLTKLFIRQVKQLVKLGIVPEQILEDLKNEFGSH